ncbi:MAG: flavodoxin family protein [Spirochaetes bacterium]|nr:flavodoxin family protein [Spirochaetota bacterium]
MSKKKILGIVASYRSLGNCEIIVKAVAAKLGDGFELSLVRLPKLKIYPCKGCYACLLPGGKCGLKDDVYWLTERMRESDAIVFAAPDYTLGPAGIVKMLSDRAIQISFFVEELKDKKTAVVLTLGKEDYRGYADTALASQVRNLGLDVVSLRSFIGTHPGEAALADDFDRKISEMADALLRGGNLIGNPPNRCPRCFSDLFRLRGDALECAVCKSLARQKGDALDFYFFHPEFTEEGRQAHMKWLLMKKQEYPSLKERLKKIQDAYRSGNWLSSDGDGK